MDNNVIGYTIAAIVVATALGNMFNIPKRMQALSRLKFYGESDSVKSTFDFGLFKKKPPKANPQPGSETPKENPVASPHIPFSPHGYTFHGVLLQQVPYPIGSLLKNLEIPPTDPYAPSSTILKSAYRKFALKTHPDTAPGTVNGAIFRDVTLDYKRVLQAIEDIEHKNSSAKE